MNSYLGTDYSGKTYKKICRKMIARLVQAFSECIHDRLDYIGMGSLFYEDFREFYPHGFMNRMTSIEYMLDREGKFDRQKYRRFLMNRPYEEIELLPLSVREAVDTLSFDRNFIAWFDYDSTITRETIEEMADVIRKAEAMGFLVDCTGTQIAYSYKDERRTLNMDAVRNAFADMVTEENADVFERLAWENFAETIRDLVTPYYERIVRVKKETSGRNWKLFKAGRIHYRQPSMFVIDLWILADLDQISEEEIETKVLSLKDAGEHFIDMSVLTERERAIISSRLEEDPSVLAEELAIDEPSIRKYIRYWDDYMSG